MPRSRPPARVPLLVVVSPASGPVRSPALSLAAFAVRSLSGWGFGASVFTEPSPLPWTPSEYRSRSPFVVSGLLGAWVCMRSSGVCRGPSLFLFSVLQICLRRGGGRRRRFLASPLVAGSASHCQALPRTVAPFSPSWAIGRPPHVVDKGGSPLIWGSSLCGAVVLHSFGVLLFPR